MEMPEMIYELEYGAAARFNETTEFYINRENAEKKLKEIIEPAKKNIINTLKETYLLNEEQISKVNELFDKDEYHMHYIPTYFFGTINNIKIKEDFKLMLPHIYTRYTDEHFEDYGKEWRKEKIKQIREKANFVSNIKEIGNEYIEFHNGMILRSAHEIDCCEYHYLDMSVMSMYNIDNQTGETINIYEREFDFSNGIPFEKVEGMGIKLIDTTGNKYLINGYGSNNGYYNSDIELVLCYHDEDDGTEVAIYDEDVSNCQDYYHDFFYDN